MPGRNSEKKRMTMRILSVLLIAVLVGCKSTGDERLKNLEDSMNRVEQSVKRMEKALGLGVDGLPVVLRPDSNKVVYVGTRDGRLITLPLTYHENWVFFPHTDGYIYKMRTGIPT